MSEHQRHAITEFDQLSDDPVIATHIACEIESFNVNFVRRELEADPRHMAEDQKDAKAEVLFGDTDLLLLGLFAVYFLVVTAATVFVLLQWGHVPWARFSELASSLFALVQKPAPMQTIETGILFPASGLLPKYLSRRPRLLQISENIWDALI